MILDLSHPLRSLRAASGLTMAAAQRAMCLATISGVTNPEQRGAGVKLATLLRVAAAYGLKIEIRVKRTKNGNVQ
jgi:transcriptional regulator with XRE-family HTH domain